MKDKLENIKDKIKNAPKDFDKKDSLLKSIKERSKTKPVSK